MFGIADFNREVMEHPEVLIPIIEEEEEEEELRLQQANAALYQEVMSGGFGEAGVAFLVFLAADFLLGALYLILRSVFLWVAAHRVPACAVGVAGAAVLLFLRRRKRKRQ
jgi:hypothetical protein